MTGSIVGLFSAPNGGVPKASVDSLGVTNEGCIGDKQNDRASHGGPQRAVCLLCTEIMEELQAEGHPIDGGTTGENLLIRGIDRDELKEGTVLKTSDVTLRITRDATPCRTIQDSFIDNNYAIFSHRLIPNRTRWYAEVIQEGTLSVGEAISIVSTNAL
jgi:MOSC domain-containing protein YiiM